MPMKMKMVRAFAVTLVMLAACADPPGPGDAPPNEVPAGVPDVAEVVCEADGSTTVRTPQVAVQPDGIHVHVISRLDEPASLNGWGFDVDPGGSTRTAGGEPGVRETACWPFTLHGTGEEPPTQGIEVLDPEGIYVNGEIECTGTASDMIADFAELPLEAGPVPLEVARAKITGLRPDDEVVHTGYPEQDEAGVAVRRDGAVVASFSFVTFDREEWSVAGATICESSEISHR
jgi:hypothetical protein